MKPTFPLHTHLNSDFSISYLDFQHAQGVYARELVTIGGQELTDMQVGISYQSNCSVGVLGIGYEPPEAIPHGSSKLTQLMVDQGLIQSNAYSLWLNDRESKRGNILFDGVDTDKLPRNTPNVACCSRRIRSVLIVRHHAEVGLALLSMVGAILFTVVCQQTSPLIRAPALRFCQGIS